MKKRRITKEEKDFIVKNLPFMSYKEIGLKINRTEYSIAHTVRKMETKRTGRAKKLIGSKIAKLLVLEYVGTDNNGYIIYSCLCDCGNKKNIKSFRLINGSTKSCGCIRKDTQYKTIENLAFKSHKEAAKNRNIESYLSKEEYISIAQKPCNYCGDVSTRSNYNTGATLPLNSVDRINNDTFYTLDSSQSVCFICQKMKGSMKHEDFLVHINKIKNCI